MYNVRMRATREEKHISGAERIIEENDISSAACSLLERALSHEKGKADFINISVEAIKIPIRHLISLPVILVPNTNVEAGKRTAKKILAFLGIPDSCIGKAFSLLEKGPADGDSMRGAIVMDMNGERLEPDKHRGIRVSRMDIARDAAKELESSLAAKDMDQYFTHISEALVLATKVASLEGNVAELCWSDDPSYTTGYVSSNQLGYIRIPHLKNEGDPRGGRVFFVNNIDLPEYSEDMEKTPVLIYKFTGLKEISDIDEIIGE
jgi:6-carboxyhexanoate--CoA ligase